jgi:hypothetical protein
MAKKRITIIRHGMPEAHLKYSNRKFLKGSEIIEFINDWNNCALSSENRIPDKLREVVANSDYFINSNLKRSINSFRLLGIDKTDSIELFNEAELPYGFLINVKMPAILWFILIRVLWVLGFRMNSESYKDFKNRIKNAYGYLSSHLTQSNHIAVMGHGFANMELKKDLKKNKWNHVENYGGHNYWSFDTYEKELK